MMITMARAQETVTYNWDGSAWTATTTTDNSTSIYGGVESDTSATPATTTYISYGALMANSVPCSTAGASYYGCASSSSGPANPYSRSCTFITACARVTD
jgi:hypothetical protein